MHCVERSGIVIKLPLHLTARFLLSGWYPGRQKPLPDHIPQDHPAAAILRAYLGLRIGRVGRGNECASSDIRFTILDPDDSDLSIWEGLLHTKLVGIGEYHNDHGELFVDGSGRCFSRSCVHDAFFFEGYTFVEAIDRLIRGLRSRPMLRPDQNSVEAYGKTYTRDDPGVFHYA